MASNALRQVPLLTLLVVICLVAFSFMPADLQWQEYALKPVNILSDIQQDTLAVLPPAPPVAKVKSPAEAPKPEKELPCPKGRTCVEDFDAKGEGLTRFMKALEEQAPNEPVRVAFFGDSFIEGDMLCGYFRDTLQAAFGGRGVGFVPLTSPVANFRVTIRHQFRNIKTYSVLQRDPSGPALGVSGFSFVPEGDNQVTYSTSQPYGASRFDRVRVFYKSSQTSELYYSLGKGAGSQPAVLEGHGRLAAQTLTAGAGKIQFSFPKGLNMYGVSFENNNGVYVDNFSIRGNSGWGLLGVSEDMYRQFNDLQHYKLVILQYGLNVIQPNTQQLGWYVPKMMSAIERIKKGFPEASILVVGVSDRSTRKDGSYVSFPSIPRLIEAQREMSRKTGVTFWNLWEAMGGPGSMVRMVNAGLANKDYTHLKYAGGRKIANLLAGALLFEKKRYDQKNSSRAAAELPAGRTDTSADSIRHF
jgi:hypothetical protein